MTSWALITYTRGATNNPWPNPSSAVIDKVTEYQNTDPKKVIHYEQQDSADDLKRYYKLGFKDIDTAREFQDSAENVASIEHRENYCNNADNGMDCLVEKGLEVEPSIPA